MAQTTKLISSVSYNTETFLAGRLHTLVDQGVLEYAYWIWHQPEEDEKKAHAHILVKPNRRLDTSMLKNEFREIVPGETKPLGVLPFRPSKVNDWLLYAVHDAAYLALKNESRKIRYNKSDIHTTEPDLLEDDWRSAHEGENNRLTRVVECAQRGVPFAELVKMGLIPIPQLFQYEKIWQHFYERGTMRGDGEKHE